MSNLVIRILFSQSNLRAEALKAKIARLPLSKPLLKKLMNIKVDLLSALLLLFIGFSSCSLFDKTEPTPAWIRIEKIDLVDNPSVNEGSLSNDITDAWVYIDDNIIGMFELPANIPILEEGQHQLLVGPGIKVSAISTLRDNYLFYEAYETTVNLIPGEVLTVEPQVRYRDEGVNYLYYVVEDFEDSFIEMSAISGSDVSILRTTDPQYTFEGKGSGIVRISDTTSAVGFRTSENIQFSINGKAVYLEIDYYTEFDLTIGLHIDNGPLSAQTLDYLTLKASDSGDIKWRKVYIALTSVLSRATNFQFGYVYFVPNINEGAPKNGVVLIDNIKIMSQI